ncbi:MAG: L,D-transpeptidase family protein [Pseudomonadota bacterium]
MALAPEAIKPPETLSNTVGTDVARRLKSTRGADAPTRKDIKALRAVYKKRDGAPMWVTWRGLTPKAVALVAEIKNAERWGLNPRSFRLPKIAAAADATSRLDVAKLAHAEVLLSKAVLKYARYARGGRVEPLRLTKFLDRKPQLADPEDVITLVSTAANPTATLLRYHPQHRQFKRLRARYVALLDGRAKAKKRIKLPAGPLLKRGVRHPHVALLRARLKIDSGPNATDALLYDRVVEAAVRAYQKRESMSADGIVGSGTRAVLNKVTGPSRAKLLANMEQWRWMPRELGEVYVWVNVPEYKIRVVRDGEIIHTERVVVGKATNQTVIFSDELEWVDFHPSWYVPESIKVNEIAPSMRYGGMAALERQGLEIRCPSGVRAIRRRKQQNLFGFWNNEPEPVSLVDIRRCQVRQPPGPRNALGIVKFKFPNKHAIYFHDTPSKHLFNKRTRTYSHGCIRVRDPLKLAEILLGYDADMSRATIDNIVNGPVETRKITMRKKIKVHITYFTALIDNNGGESYFTDVYGHDKRINLGIAGKYHLVEPVPEPRKPGTRRRNADQVASTRRRAAQQRRRRSSSDDWIKNIFQGF